MGRFLVHINIGAFRTVENDGVWGLCRFPEDWKRSAAVSAFFMGMLCPARLAPLWRQAPIHSSVLSPALRVFETLSPQPDCRTPAVPGRERAWNQGSHRIGRSNSFMDLNAQKRMIPAPFNQVGQQRPSHSVLFAGANVASIYAACRIVLLLFVFACLRTCKACLRVPTARPFRPPPPKWSGGSGGLGIRRFIWLALPAATLEKWLGSFDRRWQR